MLSEKPDTLTIWNWVKQWKKYVLHGPNETICDYSKALLGALTRAFCDGMKLSTYIETCFLILSRNNNIKLPECYIRLDITHFMKVCWRIKYFSERKKYLKGFYIRILRLLSTTEEFLEFLDKETDQYISNDEITEFDILLDMDSSEKQTSDNEKNLDIRKIDQFLNHIKVISYQNSKITGN